MISFEYYPTSGVGFVKTGPFEVLFLPDIILLMIPNNKLNLTKTCREALRIMLSIPDGTHTVEHVVRVYDWCRKLASFYPKTDLRVLKIAAYWHDVGRKEESKGKDNHNEKGSEMVGKYLAHQGLDSQFIEKIKYAILNHPFRLKPTSIEGKILHDADKLAWIGKHELPDCFESMGEGFENETMNRKIVARALLAQTKKNGSRPALYNNLLLPESKEILRKNSRVYFKIVKDLIKKNL